LISQIAVQLIMTPKAIADASSDLIVAYANAAVPPQWSTIAIIVVIIGTVGVLEASLVQAGRTIFSMGRDRVLDERLANLNSRFLTPWNATFALSIISLALFALAATSASVNDVLKNSINAIGILVAFYYGLSGIACARYYRFANRGNPGLLILRGIYPMLASLFLFAVAGLQLATAGWKADATVLGMLLAGALPMIYYRRLYKSSFYDRQLAQA
ncbi:MAG TPA: amino acid permease, partial [Candidatus Eremiobacteraceae bacterium]|nr:amino acid permease [Candidatus Eremiobacteraceae bacterium]